MLWGTIHFLLIAIGALVVVVVLLGTIAALLLSSAKAEYDEIVRHRFEL